MVKLEAKEEPIPVSVKDASQPQQGVPRRPRRFKLCLLFQQSEVGPIIGKVIFLQFKIKYRVVQ